ncbi:MAG TPA: hypothetical protein VGJ70_25150 [Solirubrobacteraceae bacterium]
MSADVVKPVVAVSSKPADSGWMLPFFAVLVGALVFFLWQVASYTTLLG